MTMMIDWHGETAKQKRESALRRATMRAFIIGAILAVIGVGGLVMFIQSQPVPRTVTLIISATPAPTATSDPQTATAQEAVARTTIAFALTSGAPTSPPTIAPTILPGQMASNLPDQLAEFRYDASPSGTPRLIFQSWLPISARPGYHLFGARFDQHGLLYIAHSRSELLTSCNAPADAEDAYWIVDLAQQPAKIVGQLRYPMMVSPKRITFDRQNNAYILAADCKQHSYAVFKFSGRGQWVDTFPIIGGADLIATGDNKILVAVVGYADTTIPQAHLLELASDPASGALQQIAQIDSGSPAGFYRALLADPTQAGILLAQWVEPKVPERLSQMMVSATLATGTLNSSDTSPKIIETSQGAAVPPVDNLISSNNQVFGLSLTRRTIFQLAAGQITPIPFNQLYARTFAIGRDYWLLAGPPDVVLKN